MQLWQTGSLSALASLLHYCILIVPTISDPIAISVSLITVRVVHYTSWQLPGVNNKEGRRATSRAECTVVYRGS